MSMTLPRPDLAERFGLTYRRIPVLAVGKDLYCDSSLMAAVLERRFPASEGFQTLFPRRKGSDKSDTGIVKALSMTYSDRALFYLGSQLLPYHKFKGDFLDDRSKVPHLTRNASRALLTCPIAFLAVVRREGEPRGHPF